MNFNDQLLAALTLYGLPVLWAATVINSIGIPIPANILLIAAGSFIELGNMNFWWVIVLGTVGAIMGDQVDYAFGLWGGRRLSTKLTGWLGKKNRLGEVESILAKWGGIIIFLSRWLVTILGSWVNLASGISSFSYPVFLIWDAMGEVVWVIIYVGIGLIFSDRI